MDTNEVKDLITKLEAMRDQVTEERDRLSKAVEHLRTSIRRLKAQLELVEKEQQSGKPFPVPGSERILFDTLGALVELTRGLLQLPAAHSEALAEPVTETQALPVAEHETTEVVPEPQPSAAKPVRPGKSNKKYGAYPTVITLLKAAFGSEEVLSLTDALQKVYGKKWKDQDIGGYSTGGTRATRNIGKDIEMPNSLLKGYLAGAFANLVKLQKDVPPGPTPRLLDLYKIITQNHTLDEIKETLISWGVPIKD